MSTFLGIAGLCLFVGGFVFWTWGLMAAAKRGDQMDEECQFNHDWRPRS